MSILEQCISYGNGNLTNKEISQLLGVIDEQLLMILLRIYTTTISLINSNIFNDSEINNYLRLLDNLIERVFQISMARMT